MTSTSSTPYRYWRYSGVQIGQPHSSSPTSNGHVVNSKNSKSGAPPIHPRLMNPLFKAINVLDAGKVRRLMEQRPVMDSLNQKNALGETAVVFVANKLSKPECRTSREAAAFSILKILVENGSDISSKDCFDDTALIAAARAEHFDAVAYLLDHGASMSSNTPLFCRRWLSLEMATVILSRPDVDAMHWLNQTDALGAGLQPLHFAALRRDHQKIRLYLCFGANPVTLSRASRMTALALFNRSRREHSSKERHEATALELNRAQAAWLECWTPSRHRYLYGGFKRRAVVLMMSIKRILPTKVFPSDLRKLLMGALLQVSYH